jgi:hypothetical protein
MSDLPNGNPPGQNNIDATTEPYVPAENDPSAGAQKPHEEEVTEHVDDEEEEPAPQHRPQAPKPPAGHQPAPQHKK